MTTDIQTVPTETRLWQQHRWLKLLLALVIICMALKFTAWGVRAHLGYNWGLVTGDSCYPYLRHMDFFISYPVSLDEIERGNLLAFWWLDELTIKKVVALPGETIKFQLGRWEDGKPATKLWVEGKLAEDGQPYAWYDFDYDCTIKMGEEIKLEPDELLLLPDNKVVGDKVAYVVPHEEVAGRIVRHYSPLPEFLVLFFQRLKGVSADYQYHARPRGNQTDKEKGT